MQSTTNDVLLHEHGRRRLELSQDDIRRIRSEAALALQRRRVAVSDLHASGWTIAELAKALGLSRTGVVKILRQS